MFVQGTTNWSGGSIQTSRAGVAGLTATADAHYEINNCDFDEDDGEPGLQNLSVHVYQGGQLDNLRFSNRADGFMDVVGTEPGSANKKSLGTIQVFGEFVQATGSEIRLEITSVEEFESILINGKSSFAGDLIVAGTNGFKPQAGDRYPLFVASKMCGEFQTITLPKLPTDLAWDTDNLMLDGTIFIKEIRIPGDFNGDAVLNLLDVVSFVQALTDSPQFELENPGVDLLDIGDFNNDSAFNLLTSRGSSICCPVNRC